eukprot:1159548-Pelagomonas_calceolata.AAC.16
MSALFKPLGLQRSPHEDESQQQNTSHAQRAPVRIAGLRFVCGSLVNALVSCTTCVPIYHDRCNAAVPIYQAQQ